MTDGAGPENAIFDGHQDHHAEVDEERGRLLNGANRYRNSWGDLTSEQQPHSQSSQRRKVSNASRRAPKSSGLAIKMPKVRSGERSQYHDQNDNPQRENKRAQTSHHSHLRGKGESSTFCHKSPAHRRYSYARTGRSGASRSPPRQQRGPDGTPFGSLPKYKSKAGITFGLGDYLINTYRHIKAEHDVGYRTRGLVEEALDDATKKKSNAKATKGRKSGDQEREETLMSHKVQTKQSQIDEQIERDPRRVRGDEGKPGAVETGMWERLHRKQKRCEQISQSNERRWKDHGQKGSQGMSVPVVHVQYPSPVRSPEQESPLVSREWSISKTLYDTLQTAPEPHRQEHKLSMKMAPSTVERERSYERRPSASQESQVQSKDDGSHSGAKAHDYQHGLDVSIQRGHGYEENDIEEYRAMDSQPRASSVSQHHDTVYSLDESQSSTESENASRASSLIMSHAPPPSPLPPPPVARTADN
jgi:hypothetical protein